MPQPNHRKRRSFEVWYPVVAGTDRCIAGVLTRACAHCVVRTRPARAVNINDRRVAGILARTPAPCVASAATAVVVTKIGWFIAGPCLRARSLHGMCRYSSSRTDLRSTGAFGEVLDESGGNFRQRAGVDVYEAFAP